MPDKSIYLDHAATTPLLPAAREAMLEGFELWANPSSPHQAGRKARAALEDARARIKAALDWDGEMIFTSGASEALVLAISRCVQPLAGVSAVEHEAVQRFADNARRIGVSALGLVDPTECALAGLVAVHVALATTIFTTGSWVFLSSGPPSVVLPGHNASPTRERARGTARAR